MNILISLPETAETNVFSSADNNDDEKKTLREENLEKSKKSLAYFQERFFSLSTYSIQLQMSTKYARKQSKKLAALLRRKYENLGSKVFGLFDAENVPANV